MGKLTARRSRAARRVKRAKLRFEQYAPVFVMLAMLDHQAALTALGDTFNLDGRQAREALALCVEFVEDVRRERDRQEAARQPRAPGPGGLSIGFGGE